MKQAAPALPDRRQPFGFRTRSRRAGRPGHCAGAPRRRRSGSAREQQKTFAPLDGFLATMCHNYAPETTPAIVCFLLLEIGKEVEALQLSSQEKAVRRILLIVEELKSDGQFRQEEQREVRSIAVQHRQPRSGLTQSGEPKDQGPRPVLSMSLTSRRLNVILTL